MMNSVTKLIHLNEKVSCMSSVMMIMNKMMIMMTMALIRMVMTNLDEKVSSVPLQEKNHLQDREGSHCMLKYHHHPNFVIM